MSAPTATVASQTDRLRAIRDVSRDGGACKTQFGVESFGHIGDSRSHDRKQQLPRFTGVLEANEGTRTGANDLLQKSQSAPRKGDLTHASRRRAQRVVLQISRF